MTAFRTWGELVPAMRGGYCPTIRPACRRARLLAKAVRASGFRVFNG